MRCDNPKHFKNHNLQSYDIETHEYVLKCDACGKVWHADGSKPILPRLAAMRVIFSNDGFKYLHDAIKIHHTAIPDEIVIALSDAIIAMKSYYEGECDDDLQDQQREAIDNKYGDGTYRMMTK